MKHVLIFLLVLTYFNDAYSQVSATERAALQAIFTALDGPNWDSQNDADPTNDWDFSSPVTGAWHGLTVNLGTVIGLNINQNNASGIMPPEIGDLVNLQRLLASNNDIRGAMPLEMGNLTQLNWLELSDNQITSIDLTGNQALRNLDVSRNQLTAIDISSNSALEFLYCSSNELTSLDLSNNPRLFDVYADDNRLRSVNLSNRSINFLHLQNNQLTALDLSSQNTLEELNIGNNSLTVLDLSHSNYLLSFDASNNQLTELHLADQYHLFAFNASHNQISTFTFTSIAPHIEQIDLSHNLLSDHSLVDRFLGFPNLSVLNISNNDFQGTLPDTSLLPLRLFHFDNNRYQFGDLIVHQSSSSTIPDYSNGPQADLDTQETRLLTSGSSTTMVTNCSGSYNVYQWFKDGIPLSDGPNISGSTSDTLTLNDLASQDSGIYHCEVTSTAITGLTLRRNNINLNVANISCEVRDRAALIALFNATDGPNWINNSNWNTSAPLNTWYGVTTNEEGCVIGLDLNASNTIGGTNGLIGVLPEELGNLLNLQELDLSHQNLSGSIPQSIGNLSELVLLDLIGNQLTGAIPASIGNLSHLQILLLTSNELSGNLPTEIGNLSQLRFFTADENQLSGPLPSSLGNLSNLEILWLYENQINGTLPNSFSNLTNLQQLILSNNRLTGNLPDFWQTLTAMEVLWLGENEFYGNIPNSMAQMPNLEQLHLQVNQLTGEIPSSLGHLNHLESLHLGDNPLSGTIPTELGNIATLKNLTIYRTNVTGVLPPELGNLSNLEILWICFNNLSGEIPESYGNLTNLVQLILDDNDLTGTLPAGFEQFNRIEYLSFSDNHLGGAIPDYSQTPIISLQFENNNFEFGDFENQFEYYDDHLTHFNDNPQAKVNDIEILAAEVGSDITLTTEVSGSQNHYTWFKDGIEIDGAPDSATFTISDVLPEDTGIYHCEITSDIVTDLVLIRNDISLTVECAAPLADELDDVTVCENYILSTLSADQYYFTEPNAEGIQLYAGERITNNRTVYIYTGVNGCSNESSFHITIDPTLCDEDSAETVDITFPKFFSPNNDGINDTWRAHNETQLSSGKVQIFDRYGKLIFQFDTASYLGWDGTSQGRPLPESDYWFRAIFKDGRQMNGHFTLKR